MVRTTSVLLILANILGASAAPTKPDGTLAPKQAAFPQASPPLDGPSSSPLPSLPSHPRFRLPACRSCHCSAAAPARRGCTPPPSRSRQPPRAHALRASTSPHPAPAHPRAAAGLLPLLQGSASPAPAHSRTPRTRHLPPPPLSSSSTTTTRAPAASRPPHTTQLPHPQHPPAQHHQQHHQQQQQRAPPRSVSGHSGRALIEMETSRREMSASSAACARRTRRWQNGRFAACR